MLVDSRGDSITVIVIIILLPIQGQLLHILMKEFLQKKRKYAIFFLQIYILYKLYSSSARQAEGFSNNGPDVKF